MHGKPRLWFYLIVCAELLWSKVNLLFKAFDKIARSGKTHIESYIGDAFVCGDKQTLRLGNSDFVYIFGKALIHNALKKPRKIAVTEAAQPCGLV